MDCIIPGHSARLFCSSIACLSKIGKDLYVDFDVATGCTLRTLNDAKSAYACMTFAPSFFERCTTPPTGSGSNNTGASSSSRNSWRVRSRTSSASATSPQSTRTTTDNQHDDEEEVGNEERFSIRLPLRAMTPVMKYRKNVVELRITSVSSPLRLAFEFLVMHQKSSKKRTNYDERGGGSNVPTLGTLMRVVHCLPASDADAVSAVTDKTGASELTCRPEALLRWLEPLLKLKTTEVAVTIEKNSKVLSAQSFHHTECYTIRSNVNNTNNTNNNNSSDTNNNTTRPSHSQSLGLLQQHHASHVKTETCMAMDELDDFYYNDDRRPDENTGDNGDMPDQVNDGVVLVFPVREARAWLQFAASHSDSPASATSSYSSSLGGSTLYFHWGGKPLVFETSTASTGPADSSSPPFTSELVLASLDHKLLAGSRTRNNGR